MLSCVRLVQSSKQLGHSKAKQGNGVLKGPRNTFQMCLNVPGHKTCRNYHPKIMNDHFLKRLLHFSYRHPVLRRFIYLDTCVEEMACCESQKRIRGRVTSQSYIITLFKQCRSSTFIRKRINASYATTGPFLSLDSLSLVALSHQKLLCALSLACSAIQYNHKGMQAVFN